MASRATSKTASTVRTAATTDKSSAPAASSIQTSATVGDSLKVGGGDQGATLSLHTYDTDASSVTSFNEIVELDEEGHPYIDINRLVYHPHHHHPQNAPHLQKEKLIWYFPDFTFILLNLMTLCVSMYFILAGITSLTWVASIVMFSLPDCQELVNQQYDPDERYLKEENFYFLPCVEFLDDPENKYRYKNTGYDFNQQHHEFPMIQTKLTTVQTFGLVLIGLQIVNTCNVIVGIHACLEGYRGILNHHITIDGMIVLGEFVISSIVTYTGICESREIEVVRMLLGFHIRWYDNLLKTPEDETDKEKLINTQVDALQINLGCCGVDSWMDYMPADWPYYDWAQSHNDLDYTELVIPHSCCRSWWLRNIYCSHGAHLWAHPTAPAHKHLQFHERIVQEGCMYKLEQTCGRLRHFMGEWSFYATILHLAFIILEAVAGQVLVKNINNLIMENKKMMKRKEMTHDPGESGSELDLDTEKLGTRADKRWTKIPPPTEDEIVTIKQRCNFNRFVANVKGGIVGRWMKEGHLTVTEGEEEAANRSRLAQMTDEERKHKEKELLHGKSSKREHVEHLATLQTDVEEDKKLGEEDPKDRRRKMKRQLVKVKVKVKKDRLDKTESRASVPAGFGTAMKKSRKKKNKKSKKQKKNKGENDQEGAVQDAKGGGVEPEKENN